MNKIMGLIGFFAIVAVVLLLGPWLVWGAWPINWPWFAAFAVAVTVAILIGDQMRAED